MITKVHATNFKSWKDTGEVRLAPITGLFGSNSSGKTSFLQLLLLLKQTTESPDRSLVLNLGDERSLVELGVFRELVFDHAADAKVRLALSWKLLDALEVPDPERKGQALFEGSDLSFTTEVEENGAGRIAVNSMTYDFAGHSFGMRKKGKASNFNLVAEPAGASAAFTFKRSQGRPWDLPAPVKCYGFPDQVKAYFQNAGFLSDLELKFEELFARVYYLGPLREYPKRRYTWAGAQPRDMGRKGELVVDALLASRERGRKISRGKGRPKLTVEEYVAHWLRELGLIHDFFVEVVTDGSNLYQVWVKTTPGSAKVLLTDVGFGVSQILPVLTLCYYVPEGSTVLMEQPEIHLHPSVQSGLADVFIDAIQKRHIQIVVESHSEHLLRRLQRRIAEEQLASSDAALYFFRVSEEKSRLVPLDVDLYGGIRNWPDGFFGDEFEDLAAMTTAKARRRQRESRR
jgi:predicted ATPase